MLIHGRMILTAHGCMLDEVRSLLQKSLRRKDRSLVTQSAKELLGFGKDQLPWKSLVTFLFEDHCLSDVKVLENFHEYFVTKNKFGAVTLLLDCYTCRVAACLPVIALDDRYLPNFWDKELKCDPAECRLVTSKPSSLNFDLILAHLKQAWKDNNKDRLITCMKMVTMVIDIEKLTVTKKGEAYLIGSAKKPNVGHVILSLLYKTTGDFYWRKYTMACFKILDIPDTCIRLVLCSVLANQMFVEHIKPVEERSEVDWRSVGKLELVPSWAVDKHTFRGKFGKGTKHLLKKTHPAMTEAHKEEFHGNRPKSGIREFFEQGCLCNKESLGEDGNPYWELTKAIYYNQPKPRLQKTVHMTKVYYDLLRDKHRYLFNVKDRPVAKTGIVERESKADETAASPSSAQDPLQTSAEIKDGRRSKRKSNISNERDVPSNKKIKSDVCDYFTCDQKCDKNDKDKASDNYVNSKNLICGKTVKKPVTLKGPLLQLPTGSAKVYTQVSIETNEVWKGPYPNHKFSVTLFYHQCLSDVLDDPHTLKVKDKQPYLVFPLVKGQGCSCKVTTRDFYDCISKQQVTDGQFINREDLGLIQLHRLKPHQIPTLPHTIWLHFIYRYLLNVGDSGMYNAIADTNLTHIYGIDMEESRLQVKGSRPVDLLFTKLPAKAICSEVILALKTHKEKLLNRMVELESGKQANRIKNLAVKHAVLVYNTDQFKQRVKAMKNALHKS